MSASSLLLFGLGRLSTLSPSQSGWRSLSEGVASPPCSPQVESAHKSAQLIWAASLPYWHGLLYRHDLPKYAKMSASLEMLAAADILTLFLEKSQNPNSAHKCPITSIQVCTESQKLSKICPWGFTMGGGHGLISATQPARPVTRNSFRLCNCGLIHVFYLSVSFSSFHLFYVSRGAVL